ncbi:MAG: YolD-like family protein [Oscillospiraceae bacterium]|nr:YolD-like family protein [Oscillospiraceae bacterium]
MGNKIRGKMPVSERAKQFAPFSALRGLPEELAEKERIIQPRKILSSDMAEQLDRMLQTLRPGHMITAVYYSGGGYRKKMGMVAAVDCRLRVLQVVEERIDFDDLFEIRLS